MFISKEIDKVVMNSTINAKIIRQVSVLVTFSVIFIIKSTFVYKKLFQSIELYKKDLLQNQIRNAVNFSTIQNICFTSRRRKRMDNSAFYFCYFESD